MSGSETLPLVELYTRVLDPSIGYKQQQEVTAHILTLYEDPNTVQQLFQILLSPQIPVHIRRSAAIGLRKFMNNWASQMFENQAAIEQITGFILQELRTETDHLIISNFCYALEAFWERFNVEWKELMDLVSEFITSNDPNKIFTALEVLLNIIYYMSPSGVAGMSGSLFGIIGTALQAPDAEIATQGAALWAAIVRQVEPPYDPALPGFLEKIIEVFVGLLVNEHANACKLAQRLAEGLGTDVPLAGPEAIFEVLLRVAANPEIPDGYKHLPLVPMKKMIKKQGKHLRRFLPDTMRLLLAVSEAQYNDTHYSEESDARSIIRLVYYICEASDKAEFVPAAMNSLCKDQNPGASFASLCALQGILDSAPELIEESLESVMEYVKSKLNFNIGVTEAAVGLIHFLATQLPTSMADYAEEWVNICLNYATMFDHEELAKMSLDVINDIFTECDNLDSSMVMGFLEKIYSLFESAPLPLKSHVVRALGGAMLACREDISNFPDSVFQLVVQASKCTGPDEMELKVDACEALGFLIRYASEKFSGDLLAECVTLLMEGAVDEDRSLACSCLRSLNMFMKSRDSEQLPQGFIPYCVNAAIVACKVKIDSENELWDTEEENQFYSTGDVVTTGLKMMNIIAKRFPKEFYETILGGKTDVPNLFGSWCKACISPLVHFYDPDISCSAIRTGASVYGIVIESKNEWDFYPSLVSIVEQTEEISVVTQCLRAYDKLMEQHPAESAPFFPAFFKIALAGLNRKLQCQLAFCEDEATRFNYDTELCTAIQDMLSTGVTTFKQEFPIQEFMATFQAIVPKLSNIEANALLGVFAMYADIGGPIPPELVPFALAKLQESNFSMVPDGIFFVRVLIRDQPQLVQEHIGSLIEFFMGRLQASVSKERYYWETVTNVISALIDTSISPQFQGAAPLPSIIGPIFARLPVRGDLKEAGFIYDAIMIWAAQQAEVVTPHMPELFRIITEVLAMPNSYFRDCELSGDRIQNMVKLFGVMSQQIPNSQEVVSQILHGDPIKLAKLQRRIA